MSLLRDLQIDNLLITFASAEEPLTKGAQGLDDILDIIESHAGDLMPETVSLSVGRKVKYTRAGAHKRLSREEPPGKDVWFQRSHPPELEMGLHFVDTFPDHLALTASAAPFDFFADDAKAQRVVSFIRALAQKYQPLGAFAHSSADFYLSRKEARPQGRNTRSSVREETFWLDGFWQLEEVFWLNVLGPSLVKKIGRRRVLSTPSEHLEELPNGSILFLTRPTPKDFDSEPARVAQAKALAHLRPKLSYDDILARLRARSAVFVPVEPRWDPDVAPFFAELIKKVELDTLYPWIAELNALEIPPVSEWLPLEAAPPTDVENPEAEIDRYEGFLAESLIAILHTEAPEVLRTIPDALVKADLGLYRGGYATYERYKVEGTLVPAVGAYLGRMMVRHLGGRWVPRKNLDEAQVIVGARAFLPFLRARHHLADRDSELRYSLTQFYRFAARHLVERGLTGESSHSGESSRPHRA